MSGVADQDLRDRFVGGMSHAACTVNIVATDGVAGRAGVTVSAMASVSADGAKPTLLVCVHHLSLAAERIMANGVLCINVLRDDQAYISDAFAGRFKEELGDKFDCTEWVRCGSGALRISDPLVAFDCRLLSGERVGTHYIFLCEVQEVHAERRGSPLIYANRAYGTPRRIESARSLGMMRSERGTRLKVGCFQSFCPYVMPGLIRAMAGTDLQLIEGDHRRLRESLIAGESEVALLYDIAIGPDLSKIVMGSVSPYVLLPAGHPLAEQSEILPTELAEEPMISLDLEPSRTYFTELMEGAGVKPLIAYRSASFETVRGMVGHGLGYTILTTKPASSMTYDGLPVVARLLVGDVPPCDIVLAYREGETLSPVGERFAALCKKSFSPVSAE